MAHSLFVAAIYALFFLSGAAALVYQVVWVRSLTLVFGGSHLAVTAVLSIFMGGLALGGYAIGRYVDRVARPLRLYGLLELGIAGSALLFAGLMRLYPSLYVALAQGRDDAPLYLSSVRLLFSIVALIVPTTLMGGTLPVVSRFVSRQPEHLRSHLSFLYGFNTLGAVSGALVAGFLLLRTYSVTTTLCVAVAANVLIGMLSLLLQNVAGGAGGSEPAAAVATAEVPAHQSHAGSDLLPVRLVLWGIGASGFCALGYEVLWTRVLTIGIGASVYGFTIILAAFLSGIALGSASYGLLARFAGRRAPSTRHVAAWFGMTQLAIGLTALLVTAYLRDIPAHAVGLQEHLLGAGVPSFRVRVWGNFILAFAYTIVPAFFMGVAFPLAGEVLARHRQAVGRAVGEVLAYNTVGAILGAGVSGLLLIHAFGIERSLQLLTVVNLGAGLLVLASLRRSRWPVALSATATLAALGVLALNPSIARLWDINYFAIFRSNQPEAFSTPEMVREAVENTDVLYYAEGTESIVSVIRVKGGEQAFITNGRVEASSHPQAQQCQYTLGHLPMLLARQPKEVLVVGMGSGMTAGATAVHPSVERVTLVEIEPRVLGVAGTFADYNHRVLDNPKVKVVFNDGRNFLMTTDRTFDVITADPIHPWFRGAGYLYSSQYFQLAAAHLRPGGVVAQWLPIYELTPQDLASVVKTFQAHFTHTMLWLTHYDAELVGSQEAFVIDEAALAQRMAVPAVAADLERVMMGSPSDLLAYFVMGTEGMSRFASTGTINTDDNLYLEFSAPFSIGAPSVMQANVEAIAAHRESILPYLQPATDPLSGGGQRARWSQQFAAGEAGDLALALFLGGRTDHADFTRALGRLQREYSWYAPGRFLAAEYAARRSLEPRLLQQAFLSLMDEKGERTFVEMSAVLVPVSRARASIMFVDSRAKVVYGQLYVDDYAGSDFVDRFAGDVMKAIRTTYDEQMAAATRNGRSLAPTAETLRRIKALIDAKVQGTRRAS